MQIDDLAAQMVRTGIALVEAIERASSRMLAVEFMYQNHGFPPPSEDEQFGVQLREFRAALKAAQEVGQ